MCARALSLSFECAYAVYECMQRKKRERECVCIQTQAHLEELSEAPGGIAHHPTVVARLTSGGSWFLREKIGTCIDICMYI